MKASTQIINQQVTTDVVSGDLLLSAAEIIALTGTVQAARQIRWLENHGWPFATAFGRGKHPRVARSVFHLKMNGKDPTRLPPAPNYNALDRLGRSA